MQPKENVKATLRGTVHRVQQLGLGELDRSLAEQLVRTYVDSWKQYDTVKLRSILDSDCVLVESDGETFRGAEKIRRELEKRIAGEYGPWYISRWDITTLVASDDFCFLEWSFDGPRSFEGASIVRYKKDKISHVREYCTTKPLSEA